MSDDRDLPVVEAWAAWLAQNREDLPGRAVEEFAGLLRHVFVAGWLGGRAPLLEDCRAEVEGDRGVERSPCGECRVCLGSALDEARRDREQLEARVGELQAKVRLFEAQTQHRERIVRRVLDLLAGAAGSKAGAR